MNFVEKLKIDGHNVTIWEFPHGSGGFISVYGHAGGDIALESTLEECILHTRAKLGDNSGDTDSDSTGNSFRMDDNSTGGPTNFYPRPCPSDYGPVQPGLGGDFNPYYPTTTNSMTFSFLTQDPFMQSIKDLEEEYVVCQALPGFSKNRVSITRRGREVVISLTPPDTFGGTHLEELISSKEEIVITLPDNIAKDHPETHFKNGLLLMAFKKSNDVQEIKL